jgi:large subunit ribosomal protein L10
MPTEAKRAAVADLVEALSGSDRAIVSDYRGLTVSDIGAVRRSLRDQGITYRVVKNRLARIAAEQAGRSELASLLDGPSAIAIGGADEVALAKGLLDAIRPFRSVIVRGGVVGNDRLDTSGVTRLSTLPSRDQMMASIAGGLAAPLAQTAGLFDAPLRSVAGLLEALSQQKQAAT